MSSTKEEDAPIDPAARRPPGLWKGTAIKLETDFIIRHKMKPSLAAVGAFHSDLIDLPAAIEVWSEALEHAPLPLSAIEVPWLPVPGARVLVDLWVHLPA